MIISMSSYNTSLTCSLTLGDIPLPNVSNCKILGVTFDQHLNFSRHVHETTSRARRTLGFITRITRGMPAASLRYLYTAMVLPQLEFCSAIWDPPSTALKSSLEGIQRRAALTLYRRVFPSSCHTASRDLPTARLLQHAKWQSLQHRRDVATIRLLCLFMGTGPPEVPFPLRLNKRTGKRTGRLQPPLSRTLRHSKSWLIRAATLWRSLPPKMTETFPDHRDDIRELCRAIASPI